MFQDPCIPASQRTAYKCDKAATEKFSRKELLDFLEKKAKEEKVDLKAEAELLDNIDVADEDEATQ